MAMGQNDPDHRCTPDTWNRWAHATQRWSAGERAVQLERALKLRDPYTALHSRRVGALAKAMAAELGLSCGLQAELRRAGELHDVGKILIGDRILAKAGPLSTAEYREILQHTTFGEQVVVGAGIASAIVAAAVRWHHERLDGRGFPDRLHGRAIPLAARIVAVADAFDAMTTARAYRTARPVESALRELRRHAGSHFDPLCVGALMRVIARARLACLRGLRTVRRSTLRRTAAGPRAARAIRPHRGKRPGQCVLCGHDPPGGGDCLPAVGARQRWRCRCRRLRISPGDLPAQDRGQTA